jgi:hypothetical protein
MRLERRLEVPVTLRLLVPVLAIVAGIAVGGAVVALGGGDALATFGTMFGAAFGSWQGWQGTLAQATPLILTGLAVALPARMGLWNLGGEGQLTIGAGRVAAFGHGGGRHAGRCRMGADRRIAAGLVRLERNHRHIIPELHRDSVDAVFRERSLGR